MKGHQKMNDVENIKIRADDVLVKFGEVIALDYFSAGVPQGIIGLLGPNGAGKSTFIRAILGLVEPEGGEITVNGLDPRKDVTSLRDMIGYMPENECLIENVDAFDLVSYMGQISGLLPDDAVRRSHEVLDFVGVGEERYRDISSYSTGMKQRVKLAQSIVHDPEILLLDEPTIGMDPKGKEDMLSLIENIGKFGKTVLMCSHLLHEVEKVSSHVLIINHGRLLKSGPMDKILEGEENRYKLEIRGSADVARAFVDELSQSCELVDTDYKEGKAVVKIKGTKSSKKCFGLAKKHDVQIRSYTPDKLTLEDVFIEAFKRGGKNGD